MIAENDIHMKEAAKEMYVLSADEMIEERCRARDDFMKQERTRNKIMKELTEALEAKDHEIELLKQQLAEALAKNNNLKPPTAPARYRNFEYFRYRFLYATREAPVLNGVTDYNPVLYFDDDEN